MKIGFGADHAGYELKDELIKYLESKGHECIDYGTNNSISVDYPDFGKLVAEKVASAEVDKGVLVCGTGIGISLAANKVKGIRAAVCSESYSAEMSVKHNNANIIAIGSRVIGLGTAKQIMDVFFDTQFEGGRHMKRVEKIMEIEKE